MGPSRHNRQNENRNKSPETNNSAHEEKKGFDMFWRVMKSPAFWTVVFNGLLCAFTYLLFQVSKESTSASKEQARAIVSFGGFTMGPAMSDKTTGAWVGQQFTVNWFNNGTLPGKGASFQQGSKPFFDDLPNTYDFPLDPDKVQGIVPPRGQFGTNIVIPRNQLEDSWHGKARIFVWGTAAYRDGFSGDPIRVSEFCTEIYQVTVAYVVPPQPTKDAPAKAAVMGDPNTTIAQISWRTCNRGAHSCYDEDCNDYSDQIKNVSH
jgi:hypothetical protein